MNYAALVVEIQDEFEFDEDDFVSNIPNFVSRAEERILRDVDLPAFKQTDQTNVTSSNRFLSTPDGFLYPEHLIVNGRILLNKDVSWIVECYPTGTAASAPIYYAIWDENSIILGPTPDSAYLAELRYCRLPESIVTAGTTWLGDNAGRALFAASCVEAAIHMRADDNVLAIHNERYKDALQGLSIFGNIRMKKDENKERSRRPDES